MGMVQVSLTLLLYTFRNFCAKFTKPLNLTSVGANFDQKKILCSNKSVKLTLWTFEPCQKRHGHRESDTWREIGCLQRW